MSFDVWLVPPDEAMSEEGARTAIDRALAEFGADLVDDEIAFRDGSYLTFYGEPFPGGYFSFRHLDARISAVIFAVADATGCFIVLSEPPFLRTPSNRSPMPAGFDETFEPVDVPDADDLLRRMEVRFLEWSDYRNQIVGKQAKPSVGGFWRRLLNKFRGY